jgi:DNA-binding MarR family transcriptional regulator
MAPKSIDSQELADQLHSASIHLLRKLRREDASSGLSAPRLSALSVLVFGGPKGLRDLAAAEQVRPPTMTRIVDGLETQGLVMRVTDPADRRGIWILATDTGKALLMEGKSRRVNVLAQQIAELRQSERKQLSAAVEILSELIREMP